MKEDQIKAKRGRRRRKQRELRVVVYLLEWRKISNNQENSNANNNKVNNKVNNNKVNNSSNKVNNISSNNNNNPRALRNGPLKSQS